MIRTGIAAAVMTLFAGFVAAQEPVTPPTFKAALRLEAGTKLMGEDRYYPSPVFHDVDGDGRKDIVIGDLMGKMTVALRQPGDGAPRFGAEKTLEAEDGQALKFHNW